MIGRLDLHCFALLPPIKPGISSTYRRAEKTWHRLIDLMACCLLHSAGPSPSLRIADSYATMSLGVGTSVGSITGDEGDTVTDRAVNQVPNSDPGADELSDSAQPDLGVSKEISMHSTCLHP